MGDLPKFVLEAAVAALPLERQELAGAEIVLAMVEVWKLTSVINPLEK
jgi:hypothetical protein